MPPRTATAAKEVQQESEQAAEWVGTGSPGRSFDLGLTSKDPHKDTNVEISTDRQERDNVALVAVGPKVKAVQDDPQCLKEDKPHSKSLFFVFGSVLLICMIQDTIKP